MLPKSLDAIISELANRTGWSFLVLAGGPDPTNDGKIRTVSLQEGTNQIGQTFAKSHPTFEADYIKPFHSFLKHSYRKQFFSSACSYQSQTDYAAPSVRQARRLIRTNTPAPPGHAEYITERTEIESDRAVLLRHAITDASSTVSADIGGYGDTDHQHAVQSDENHAASAREPDDDDIDQPGTPEGWLDPALRSSSIIVAPPTTQSPDRPQACEAQCPTVPAPTSFPPHPPQSWEAYGYASQPQPTACIEAAQADVQVERNLERNARARRVPASKATARDWLHDSRSCLDDSDYGDSWSDCVNTWFNFEQSLPLVELSSVSPSRYY
jgi:hypothetical protein